jgi:rhodanese-related sulfurtransferase
MKNYVLSSVIVALLVILNLNANSQGKSYAVSPNWFAKSILSDEGAVVIDLRTNEEVKEGIIKGAIQFNFYDEGFDQSVALLDKSKNYYIYCKSGGRSAKAATKMVEMGLTVYDLKGGITAWKSKNKPMAKKDITF